MLKAGLSDSCEELAMQTLKDVIPYFVCGLLFFLALLTFKWSADQVHQDHLLYCRMVQKGAWPDFHHSYWTECAPLFGPIYPPRASDDEPSE